MIIFLRELGEEVFFIKYRNVIWGATSFFFLQHNETLPLKTQQNGEVSLQEKTDNVTV